MQGCYDREYWILITILCKIMNRRIVEIIQSGWVGRQNGRKLWSRWGCTYKIEIPIYRFFFGIRYFSVLYSEYRLRYRYLEIPRYSVSVTDPGLMQMIKAEANLVSETLAPRFFFILEQKKVAGQVLWLALRPKSGRPTARPGLCPIGSAASECTFLRYRCIH